MLLRSAILVLLFLTVIPLAESFPLPYEIVIESEEDIYRYSEEGFFEGYDPDELVFLYRFKTELNTADYNALMNLPYMKSSWAKAIVKARKKEVISSVKQLPDITGMSRRDLMLISPFITTRWAAVVRSVTVVEVDRDSSELRQDFRIPGYQAGMRFHGRSRISCSIESGSTLYESEEYKIKAEDWFLRRKTGSLDVIAGHYRISFDQGLGVSGGSIRSAHGIYPDLSSAEHFYGIAAEGHKGMVTGTVFFSDIKKDDYIYVLRDGFYEYQKVENCTRERGAGCRTALHAGLLEGSAGVYFSGKEWETARYCFAGSWNSGAGEIAWEAAGDGKVWAFQGTVSGGKADKFSARYYSNKRQLELPLSDTLRNSVESYWEGSYAGSWSGANYGITMRSSHSEESETLTYAYCRIKAGGKGRITCRYNRYSESSSYYSVKCTGTTPEIPVWFEYTAYESGYEKYAIGGSVKGKKTGASLYVSYGGVYEWTSRFHAAVTWEPGKSIYARCGYAYSDVDPSDHELDIAVRISLY